MGCPEQSPADAVSGEQPHSHSQPGMVGWKRLWSKGKKKNGEGGKIALKISNRSREKSGG